VRFAVPGLTFAIAFTFGLGALRFVAPRGIVWVPLVLVCGIGGFVAGWFTPTPTDDEDVVIDLRALEQAEVGAPAIVGGPEYVAVAVAMAEPAALVDAAGPDGWALPAASPADPWALPAPEARLDHGTRLDPATLPDPAALPDPRVFADPGASPAPGTVAAPAPGTVASPGGRPDSSAPPPPPPPPPPAPPRPEQHAVLQSFGGATPDRPPRRPAEGAAQHHPDTRPIPPAGAEGPANPE
jgi:hypothetical protein